MAIQFIQATNIFDKAVKVGNLAKQASVISNLLNTMNILQVTSNVKDVLNNNLGQLAGKSSAEVEAWVKSSGLFEVQGDKLLTKSDLGMTESVTRGQIQAEHAAKEVKGKDTVQVLDEEPVIPSVTGNIEDVEGGKGK